MKICFPVFFLRIGKKDGETMKKTEYRKKYDVFSPLLLLIATICKYIFFPLDR